MIHKAIYAIANRRLVHYRIIRELENERTLFSIFRTREKNRIIKKIIDLMEDKLSKLGLDYSIPFDVHTSIIENNRVQLNIYYNDTLVKINSEKIEKKFTNNST